LPDQQPDEEASKQINDSSLVAPSQVWEELSDEQREHMRSLLTQIAQRYVRARRETQPDEDMSETA
jgi:TRAP-type C4-dicarboxylate transport system substrate-binding protein